MERFDFERWHDFNLPLLRSLPMSHFDTRQAPRLNLMTLRKWFDRNIYNHMKRRVFLISRNVMIVYDECISLTDTDFHRNRASGTF
jgi:hypothetical protein